MGSDPVLVCTTHLVYLTLSIAFKNSALIYRIKTIVTDKIIISYYMLLFNSLLLLFYIFCMYFPRVHHILFLLSLYMSRFGLCLSVCVFPQGLVVSDCAEYWQWCTKMLTISFTWAPWLGCFFGALSDSLHLQVFSSGLVSFQGQDSFPCLGGRYKSVCPYAIAQSGGQHAAPLFPVQ